MSSIDISLVDKSCKNVARAFVCEKCHKVSLYPLQCANNNCAKIICKECVVNSNETCISCYGLLSPIIKNMEIILELIKFKCPKGCTSLFEGKDFIKHINNCRPKPIELPPNKIPDLNDIYLLMKKQERSKYEEEVEVEDEDEDEDDDDSSSESEDFVSSLKTADLKKDRILMQLKGSDLESLDKSQLRVIVESRGMPVSGTKEELIARITSYKSLAKTKITMFSDNKLREMVLKELTNEELEDILMARDLKKSGNKDEKVRTLLKYILAETKITMFSDNKLGEMVLKELTNEELEDILMARDLKKSGNKDEKVRTLLKYILVETNLTMFADNKLREMVLKELTNEELEDILMAKDLKKSGNKDEKIRTLLKYILGEN